MSGLWGVHVLPRVEWGDLFPRVPSHQGRGSAVTLGVKAVPHRVRTWLTEAEQISFPILLCQGWAGPINTVLHLFLHQGSVNSSWRVQFFLFCFVFIKKKKRPKPNKFGLKLHTGILQTCSCQHKPLPSWVEIPVCYWIKVMGITWLIWKWMRCNSIGRGEMDKKTKDKRCFKKAMNYFVWHCRCFLCLNGFNTSLLCVRIFLC